MSDSYIIEIEDDAAGILVRDGDGFAFHAASAQFFGLQGSFFAGPLSAEFAVRQVLRMQKKVAPKQPHYGAHVRLGRDRQQAKF
jgi:hypothetical protein